MLTLWRASRDTVDIARKLGRSEAEVANRLAQLRDEDGEAMTPTQYAFHHARKQRLARFSAAAARVTPAPAVAKPAAAPRGAPVARTASVGAEPSRSALKSAESKACWFRIIGESETGALPAMPSAREIQKAVCTFYDVELRDLLSPRRSVEIARPRQVAVYLCKQLTMLSMPKIGKLFGDRDHTTILAANRRIAALLKTDKDLRLDVEALTEQLSNTERETRPA